MVTVIAGVLISRRLYPAGVPSAWQYKLKQQGFAKCYLYTQVVVQRIFLSFG